MSVTCTYWPCSRRGVLEIFVGLVREILQTPAKAFREEFLIHSNINKSYSESECGGAVNALYYS